MELPEIPSALFASSKYTKMENTVTPVLTLKVVFLFVDLVGLSALSNAGKSDVCNFFCFLQEFVQCVVNKYSTPSFTNKAMYNANQMLVYCVHCDS